MLTPAKIKNHHFEASGRNSYRADAVDRFFEEVSESYEQMFRENGEMCKKISLLAERLEEYRKDEDNIRNALLTAQRMSEQIQREARERAETILAEVAEREQSENARIDAQTSELMSRAATQARTIIEDAQRQAEKIIYDATHESKEAAISARDWMIREEAALEMMKAEVSKFKKQILDAYRDQLALIEQIPEIASVMVDEARVVEEAPAAPVIVEEAVADATPVVETTEVVTAIESETAENDEDDDETPVTTEIGVDALQQMITDAEDTNAEDEVEEDDDNDEDDEVFDEDAELVIPSVDEENDAETDFDGMVSFFSDAESSDDSSVVGSEARKEGTFKLDMANIPAYGDDDEDDDYIDELDDDDEDDDDDDDDGVDLASKLKNFFKK